MSHVKFDNINGTTKIIADFISRLKIMGLYDSLVPE